MILKNKAHAVSRMGFVFPKNYFALMAAMVM